MKHNWPEVVGVINRFVAHRTKILARTPNETLWNSYYFRQHLFHTDVFHPIGSEGQVGRALSLMPKSCNYRSVKSYWAYKNGKEQLVDACYEILTEMEEAIQAWHSNVWNHGPNYQVPLEVTFDSEAEGDAVVLARQLIALCKKT